MVIGDISRNQHYAVYDSAHSQTKQDYKDKAPAAFPVIYKTHSARKDTLVVECQLL
jgi:hypothetical protein